MLELASLSLHVKMHLTLITSVRFLSRHGHRKRLGYVRNPRSLMEGTETLCPHATILNHCWLPGTRLGSSA